MPRNINSQLKRKQQLLRRRRNVRYRRWLTGQDLSFSLEANASVDQTTTGVSNLFSQHPLYDEFPHSLTPYGIGLQSHTNAQYGNFTVNPEGDDWSYQNTSGVAGVDTVEVFYVSRGS